jgi:hypothetical protein
LIAITAFVAPAFAEKRVALVIGNNDYRNVPPLQKAVNDARAMSDALKQLGFTVLFAENQNRKAFSETMLAFDKAVDPGDTAFFFFAGHGFEINGQNYLLPTDIAAVTQGQGRIDPRWGIRCRACDLASPGARRENIDFCVRCLSQQSV